MQKLNQNGYIEDWIGPVIGSIIGLVVLAGIVFGSILVIQHNNQWNSQRGRGDAEVGDVNNDKRTVYQMPDRFGNVAMFCDKYGNAIYTTTSDPNRSLWGVKDGCQ